MVKLPKAMQDYELAIIFCLREYVTQRHTDRYNFDTEVVMRCRLVSRRVNIEYLSLYKPMIDKQLIRMLPYHTNNPMTQLMYLRLCDSSLLLQHNEMFLKFDCFDRHILALVMEKVVYATPGFKESVGYICIQEEKERYNQIVNDIKLINAHPTTVHLDDVVWLMQEALIIESRMDHPIRALAIAYFYCHGYDIEEKMRRYEKLPNLNLIPFMAQEILTVPLHQIVTEKNLLYQGVRMHLQHCLIFDAFERGLCSFVRECINRPHVIFNFINTLSFSFSALLPQTIAIFYSILFAEFTGNANQLQYLLTLISELSADHEPIMRWGQIRNSLTLRLPNEYEYLIELLSQKEMTNLFKSHHDLSIVALISDFLDNTKMSTPMYMRYVRLLVELDSNGSARHLILYEIQKHMITLSPNLMIQNIRYFKMCGHETMQWFKNLSGMLKRYIESMSFESNQLVELLEVTQNFNFCFYYKPQEAEFYLTLFRATKKRKCHHCKQPLLKCIAHMRQLFSIFKGVDQEFERVWIEKCARMIRQRVKHAEEKKLIKKTLAEPVIIFSDDEYPTDDEELCHFSDDEPLAI